MARVTSECVFCLELIELADDGAWQGLEDGACGCTASLRMGGDGEHEPASEQASRLERFGTTDAGFEERILDAEIAAAEPREEV